MNDIPRQKLRELVGRYGRTLCDDPLRCEGLFRDFCGENRLEIFALSQAVKDGIPSELLNSSGQIPVEVLVMRFSKRLEDRYGMNSDLARWAVESWMLALGLASDDQFKPSTPLVTTAHALSQSPPARDSHEVFSQLIECPFCKEDIQDGAIKCKHCGSILAEFPPEYGTQGASMHLTSNNGKSKRRWFPYMLLLFVLTAFAIGYQSFKGDLFESRAVKLVKTGHLQNYPQRTVGEAIDSFFGDPKWESGTSADGETKGKTFVNAKGKIKFMEKDVDAILQFIITEEVNTFKVHALEFNNIPQNQFIIVGLLEKMYATSEPKLEKNAKPVPAQEGGSRAADEDINTARALFAVYGNFNPVDKTALWKNIAPKEKLESTNLSGTDGIVTAVFSEHYTEGSKEKYIVVTKTLPAEEDFTCHACAPIIGVMSFVRNNGKWVIESESKFVTTSGEYGELPKVKLIRLGADKYGLRFDGSGGGMGYAVDYMFIVTDFTNGFKEIFDLTTGEDATGTCVSDSPSADCNWKYDVKVDFTGGSTGDFYDIRAVKSGTLKEEENSKISAVNETTIYIFNQDKLKYVVAKKTAQPVPALAEVKIIPPTLKGSDLEHSRASQMDKMKSFISEYLRANEKKELDKVLSFYGDNVDYYSNGLVQKTFIKKDKETYFAFCHTLSYTLVDDLKVSNLGTSDRCTLTFTTSYIIESAKKNIMGTAINTWQIDNVSTNPKIIIEKQTVLDRKETKTFRY
ncbi:MAG: zinc ribbon domain-containing protein [Syntrophobacteraceae bacterium]